MEDTTRDPTSRIGEEIRALCNAAEDLNAFAEKIRSRGIAVEIERAGGDGEEGVSVRIAGVAVEPLARAA